VKTTKTARGAAIRSALVAILMASVAGAARANDVPALKVERGATAQQSIEAATRGAAEEAGRARGNRLIASLPGPAAANADYLDRMVVATHEARGRTLLRRMLLKNADALALLNQDEAFLAAWVEQRARRLARSGGTNCDLAAAMQSPDELRDQIEAEGSIRRVAGLAAQAPADDPQLTRQAAAAVRQALTASQRTIVDAGLQPSASEEQRCRADLVWSEAVLAAPAPHRLPLLRAYLGERARDPALAIDETDLADARRVLAALPAQPLGAYPPVAAAIGAEGVLKVAVVVEPSGSPKSATIAARQVTVPGLVGLEPVIFERWFDDVSLKTALARSYEKRSAGGTPASYTVEIDVPWRLQR